MNSELRESYNTAIEILKDNSSSFYTAFKTLPEEKFLAVASIYAYCRVCDDIVDEDNDKASAEKRLNDLEYNINAFYNNEAYDMPYPWWDAFETTVKKFKIKLEPFLMQIRGQRMDLKEVEIEDLDHLLQYCRLVAGSVGLMLAGILAKSVAVYRDKNYLDACLDLGIGMQITNILRDIGEDLVQRNRVYVPKTLLEKNGLTKEDLISLIENDGKNLPDNFISLWEELAALSEKYYAGIKNELCNFDPDVRLSVYSSALIYKEILDVVRKNNYNCLTKRNYTNKVTMLKLLNTAKKTLKEVCNE